MTQPAPVAPPPPDQPPRLIRGVWALRHRNFRLLWSGQLVSAMGDHMQTVAMAWHIYDLTGSTVSLGLIALFRLVPFISLGLVGGALADAMDRRRLMLLTQTGQMLVTLFLFVTAVVGVDGPLAIYLAAFLGGGLQAFDGPARQALIPNLVPRADLTNAITLNTLIRQVATIVGPGAGGVSIALFGTGVTYGINALTFLAVIAALLAMNHVHVRPPAQGSNLERVKDGLRFARGEPLVLYPLLLDFVTRALGSPRGLLPVFARDVFHAGPVGMGWLGSAAAVGAVGGGLVLGSMRELPRPILLLLLAYLGEGLSNGLFALMPSFWLAWLMLLIGGVCNVTGEVIYSTVGQLRSPDAMRGRTTALANTAGAAGPQTGQIEIGLLGSVVGPVAAASFNGFAAAGATLAVFLIPSLRARLGTRHMGDLAREKD